MGKPDDQETTDELRLALISRLSKEIESNTSARTVWRSRINFTVLAEGRSMKEAAGMLDITSRTIAFHKYGIIKKLGLETNKPTS